MTVCVSAFNMFGEIVSASDQMLSMSGGAFTAESVALKGAILNSDWRVMFAADDVGLVPGLLRRLGDHISKAQEENVRTGFTWEHVIPVGRMCEIVGAAYQEERLHRAAEQCLTPNGVTLAEFHSNGEHIFGETGAAVIRERLEQYQLRCELLVCGYDGDPKWRQSPHILSVVDPGIVRDHDVAGYWAIGTGAYLALSSLAVRQQSTRQPTSRTIYNVCEAKFVAEAAFGVGRDTFVEIHNNKRAWTCLEDKDLGVVRAAWERFGRPKQPKETVSQLSSWLKDAKWNKSSLPSSSDS